MKKLVERRYLFLLEIFACLSFQLVVNLSSELAECNSRSCWNDDLKALVGVFVREVDK